jgi:type I restriction enzyme R subunit
MEQLGLLSPMSYTVREDLPLIAEKSGRYRTDNPQTALKRRQFLSRLTGEIAKRGVIDVLRRGVKIYPADLVMFYMTPSEKNPAAKQKFEQNIFSVTRQLMYSKDNTRLALDFCVFINGLPIITCELKNQLTKQDVEDAVYQYKTDRDSKELLFTFKRCMVHFAVDDARVKFCTKLTGKASWFLPFDKGYNDGAGNPPNPDGIMTDYLWKEILTKYSLANIIDEAHSSQSGNMSASMKQAIQEGFILDVLKYYT